MLDREHIDCRIGEAWSGDVPNGSHINMVLAWRGSPTAAVAVSALANPRAGHAPVVVCLGAGNAVRPVTIMTNKATATEDLHQRITWGAAQLGIGQGVMDAVAEGPTLVIRLGAGRTGDYYSVAGERTTIGRAPECDVFLDDVTVSREHAVLERQPDGLSAVPGVDVAPQVPLPDERVGVE